MMRKLPFSNFACSALILLFVAFATNTSMAQCANDNTFYVDITPSGDGDVEIANLVYGGDLITAGVCAGVTYEISMCSTTWDSQITLYDMAGNFLDYDDDGCGVSFGPSYLLWTATYTGTLNIVVDLYDCQTNATGGTLVITQIGTCADACASNNVLYNVNASPTGAGNTVTVNNMYGGEYVNVNVCAGAEYVFSGCAATYDSQMSLYTTGGTLLAYDDDGCGTFAGPSYISWTSDVTGTVRLLLDQYPCVSNTTNTTVSITQLTSCPVSCSFTGTNAFYNSCYDSQGLNTQEWVDFYAYYTGDCTVSALYLYSDVLGWETIDVLADGFTSGDVIGILLGLDNTTYTYYFELSDGTTSLDYFYTTGQCPEPVCAFTNMSYLPLGCDGSDESVAFYPTYTGACTIDGIWSYTDVLGWIYTDLSANGYTSGDAIELLLGFDNTTYLYYFVLDNGVTSLTYSYDTGTCDVSSCSFTTAATDYQGCDLSLEVVDFYAYYTGACSVYSMWFYDSANGWVEVVFSTSFGSGDPIGITLPLDNTTYQYYFELSDGTTSDIYIYTTGNCDSQVSCSNLSIDFIDTGCVNTGVSNVPSGDILPFYDGSCTIAGVYSSVNGGAYSYLDLSANGYTSGDPISLYFNFQNADYQVYYELSDGSVSPLVYFTTTICESGEMICDCAGTQIPIEATAWLGDASLDDGSFFWNNNPDYPVNFNCATWGFDCGDELPAGYFSYDPYGVCSGAIPPSNGCVDEFCYNVDVDVITDCHPEDIAVFVYNSNGDLVFTASNADFIIEPDFTYTFPLCLPADCYTYMITDVYGDGLAGGDCSAIGYTGVFDYSTASYTVYVNGDNYLSVYSGEFCVGPQTVCENLEMAITTGPCTPSGNGSELLPSIEYTFDFSGPCTVQSIFYSVNGAAFVELDVTGEGWTSGSTGGLYNLLTNSDYVIYYTTDDGASSYLYDFSTTDCNNEITICDCDGTQLSIGVTAWLGDGFADNGFYQWAGQYVNFNCSTWGYDCGDIDGAPTFDPYNVCDGQLPPFNGCGTTQEILGCTDPTAINFDSAATINDGSCIYDILVGCTDPAACNYNDLAIVDNQSCEYISCAGCMDETASNYDPTATQDDGSCIYIVISGCTDPDALNYDPIATDDDGSCIFNCIWPTVVYDAHCMQGDLDNFYIDVDLNAIGNGSPYTVTNSYNNQQAVMNLLGSITMGPFPIGQQVVVQVTSNSIDCLLTSQPLEQDCSVAGVYGCTDPEALNYNPSATIDDGSCVYIGVDEYTNSNFALYPNPAKDAVTITNNGNKPLVNVRILDNTGRLVVIEQLSIASGTSHTLNVAALAQGNYVIEILTEGNVEHHNLIIQK